MMQDPVDEVSWELLSTYEALSSLYKSARLLATSTSTEQAAYITLDCAVEVTESYGGMLYLPVNDTLESIASVKEGESVKKAALDCFEKYGNTPCYEDNETGPIAEISTHDGKKVESCLYVPFSMGDALYGYIYLFSTSHQRYSSIETKVVQPLCYQGALAIQCLIQMDEIKEKNITLTQTLDQLTQAQEELLRSERLSALGQMAAKIVHDLKNPMGGLLGYAQLMEAMAEKIAPKEIKEYSGVLIREMRRLSNMTEEIMDYSRGLESKLNLREVTPRDLVAVSVPVIEAELRDRGIALHWDKLITDQILMADSDKMERVFINLAVNARQAITPPGSITISSFQEDHAIVFSIKDTGMGIPPEIRDRIFEPFVSKKEGEKGLGLGLSVVRWVVEAHGGKIWLHSTSEEGTDFRIRLPLRGSP